MSNGGGASNTATGATGDQPTTARIDSPIAKGPNAPEAPGGKGGFPSAQSPYSQQPQVYMPPAQPTFYDQALNSPYSQSQFYRPQQQFYQPAPQYYQQQPQYYQPQYYQPQPQINSFGLGSLSGGMGMGNAYARRPQYSPPSPIEARPPMNEMRMGVMGGGEEYWRNRRGYGQFVGPTSETIQVMPGKGNVPEPMYTTLGPESLGGLGGLNPIAPPTPEQQRLSQQQYEADMAAFRAAHPNAGRS